jgi:hypothetical protein
MKIEIGSIWTDKYTQHLPDGEFVFVEVLNKRKRNGRGERLITYKSIYCNKGTKKVGEVVSIPARNFRMGVPDQ